MIVFEVDCNSNIGMGHIMRCLTIADNLTDDIRFITRSLDAKKIIEEREYEVYLANGEYNNVIFDEYLYRIISQTRKIDLCIVDSYYVNNVFFESLKEYTKILYIDDLNKEKWSVDYLLNSNLSAFFRDYENTYQNTETIFLLGPEYLLLRDDFIKCNPISIKKKIKHIFISSGGADSKKSILRILRLLLNMDETSSMFFHVLVGQLNLSLCELQEIEKQYSSVKIYYNVTHIAKIMKKCDLAISAAGNTLYELAYLGIPTITYTVAENQKLGAEVFVKSKMMYSLNNVDELFEFRLKKVFISLIKDYETRYAFHQEMYNNMNSCKKKEIVDVINNIIQGDVL